MKMDANREAARAALRRCMEMEFAAVGAEDELPAPSPALEARMEKLLRQEKKTVPFRGRRALVAAAIVAACLALVAWTPVGDMAARLFTTVYEEIVSYRTGPDLRTQIETVYAPLWMPEGFEEVSREMLEDWDLTITYRNAEGKELRFNQCAPIAFSGSMDNENIRVEKMEIGDREVLLGISEKGAFATWIQDHYLMDLTYFGKIETETLEQIILSVAPEA